MFRSWKLGRVFGIDIYVHWTFLLLLGYLLYSNWGSGGAELALYVFVLAVAAFGCVVLHELGHALMARHFGIPTRDITLYPIGGIARLARMSEKPWEEFWIALAGPAVNVLIVALLVFPAFLTQDASSLGPDILQSYGHRNVLYDLLRANLMLIGFNILPAFPMDGGRVLRAILAMFFSRLRATEIAAKIGAGFAAIFAFSAIVGVQPLLLLIAGFLFLAGQQELAFLRRVEHERKLRMLQALRLPILDAIPVPGEPGFSGAIWDPRARVWLTWRNGSPAEPQ